MKVEFTDWDYGSEIMLVPENMEEVCGLLRMSKNASSKKPELYFSFRNNEPFCSLVIDKRKPSVQIKSIKP